MMEKNNFNIKHYSVMAKEVLNFLELDKCKLVVDCTLGLGGHALEILKANPKVKLVGIDTDKEALKIASENLSSFKDRVIIRNGNFSQLDEVLSQLNITSVDAFLFDLGVSMYQLRNSQRGFSFLEEGRLDMRMNQSIENSAYDLVNNLSQQELEEIFWQYGQERYARNIAKKIVLARTDKEITTTKELAEIIRYSVPRNYRYGRIHPATRSFQALRIAVNRELEVLPEGLEKAVNLLAKGARIVFISFHSLEDRIVKHRFKELAMKKIVEIITKKPITPSQEELSENLASGSAKLRVAQKI